MNNLEKLTCENCGGRIDPVSLRCEYCGTQYKSNGGNVLYVQSITPKVDILEGRVIVPEHVFMMDTEAKSQYVLKMLTAEIARGLRPYMDMRMYSDPMRMEEHFNARVRVLRPDARL